MYVIHRHSDESNRMPEWHLSSVSVIITLRKRGRVMAVKYTEEQLNNVDKSFLILLLLHYFFPQSSALTYKRFSLEAS